MMKEETIYVRVYQGKYDKEGNYHQHEQPTDENITQLLDWGLAEEIDILDFFEGKARWGSGNYMIDKGITYTGNTQWDSTG
jgi:hypothetical protein